MRVCSVSVCGRNGCWRIITPWQHSRQKESPYTVPILELDQGAKGLFAESARPLFVTKPTASVDDQIAYCGKKVEFGFVASADSVMKALTGIDMDIVWAVRTSFAKTAWLGNKENIAKMIEEDQQESSTTSTNSSPIPELRHESADREGDGDVESEIEASDQENDEEYGQ